MSDVPESALFDPSRFSEAARRRLYDRIVEIEFGRPEVRHTPDDAGLQVLYLAGRWFATWIDLEEPTAQPFALRFRIARIGWRPELPGAIELYDV